MAPQNKILALEDAVSEIETKRRSGQKVVFTNGCFDILHAGHVRYLTAAREKGGLLVVGLNSDASVRTIKGPKRPVIPQGQRAEVLAAMACIDIVVIFGEPDPLKLIQTLKPDILVKGADWPEDKIIGGEFVRQRGGQVVRIVFEADISTSEIIKRINEP